ncbi:Uma2 family endonuclease [Kovacikia minuta CCNUW1]|uniref:Uma2 family endonuclease n=1 Tax=Kovacikia minuta TaxID=2931930 RepID=UPI001CCC3BCA|nr:Uma2 family endonuclease [Kovacikia minuta]UBF27129.1 Uma2 family endonuclease [Kovacikia minuta CCNUW1]
MNGFRATTRKPDLMVLSVEAREALRGASRGTITPDMPAQLLVIEVVSPGQANEDRDYRYKRSEYASRGIAEYWIVEHPLRASLTVLTLVNGRYQEAVFQGADAIRSVTFPFLNLTVDQVLSVGI